MKVASIAPAVGPGPGPGQFGAIREGIVHFFRTPPPVATVQQRVGAVLAAIDWSNPRIVLWLPGTSEVFVKPEFVAAVHAQFGAGQRIELVPYEASWRLSHSVPDGAAVLRGVLEGIRAHAGRHEVYVGAHSQGAWITSDALADPALAPIITRATLWGHPAAAQHHFDGAGGKEIEINDPNDVVTLSLGGDSARVLSAIELLARRDVRGVPQIALLGVRHLGLVATWVKDQAWRVPGLTGHVRNPHAYSDDTVRGVKFLATGAAGVTAVSTAG